MPFDILIAPERATRIWSRFRAYCLEPYRDRGNTRAIDNWFAELYFRRRDQGIELRHQQILDTRTGKHHQIFVVDDRVCFSQSSCVLSAPHETADQLVGVFLRNLVSGREEIGNCRRLIEQLEYGQDSDIFLLQGSTALETIKSLLMQSGEDDLSKNMRSSYELRVARDRPIGLDPHRDNRFAFSRPRWGYLLINAVIDSGPTYFTGYDHATPITAFEGTTTSHVMCVTPQKKVQRSFGPKHSATPSKTGRATHIFASQSRPMTGQPCRYRLVAGNFG